MVLPRTLLFPWGFTTLTGTRYRIYCSRVVTRDQYRGILILGRKEVTLYISSNRRDNPSRDGVIHQSGFFKKQEHPNPVDRGDPPYSHRSVETVLSWVVLFARVTV